MHTLRRRASTRMLSLCLVSAAFAPLAPLVLSACDDDAATTREPDPFTATACESPFSAAVRVGPNAGLALEGRMVYHVAVDGLVWGQLEPAGVSGTPIPFQGQARGRLVGLTFFLPADPEAPDMPTVLYGTGISQQPIGFCGATLGGTFAGPEEGDIGDWLLDGGSVIRTVTFRGPCRFAGGVCSCTQTQTQCLDAGGTNGFCTTCCETSCEYSYTTIDDGGLIDESLPARF